MPRHTLLLALVVALMAGAVAPAQEAASTADQQALSLDDLEKQVDTLLKYYDVDWTTALRARLQAAYPERDANSLTDALILAVNSRLATNRVLVMSAKLDALRTRLAPTLQWSDAADGLAAAEDMYKQVVGVLKVQYNGLQTVLTELNEVQIVRRPVLPDSGEDSADDSEDPPTTAKRGRIVIDNPSPFELRLKVNGVDVRVQARGVTTIPAEVEQVTTQVGNFTQTRKTWNNWRTVNGKEELRITVRSAGTQYWLQ